MILRSFFSTATRPACWAVMVALSLVARISPACTSPSSFTTNFHSSGRAYSSWIISACSMWTSRMSAYFSDCMTRTTPPISATTASPFGILRASKSSSTRGKPVVMSAAPWEATPPVWKVRSVNCVPGSPMDWAATIPTADPSSTISPRPKSMP